MMKRLILKSVIPAVLLVCSLAASKANCEEKNMDITDCLELTSVYSRDILLAKEGINISEGRYIEERASAFPYIGTETGVKRYRDEALEKTGLPPVISKLLGMSGPTLEQSELEAKITLAQPVFTWGQVTAAINAAKYDMLASEFKFKEIENLVLKEAATVFYGLLLAVELEKAANNRMAQKKRHLKETERRYKMEVSTDYDVLSAQVALANTEPELVQARNAIRLFKDRVRYFTGIHNDFEPEGSLVCNIKNPEKLENIIQEAHENRPDIKYCKSQTDTFSELVRVAKGSNKPRLDFKGELGVKKYIEYGEEYPGKNWNAGLYLTFPLFDGFRGKGMVMQAQSKVRTYELELKKLEDQILLDARLAINDVNESIKIVRALEASKTQAERLLQMAESGYGYGVKTKLEVDDAETNLLLAETNLAKARHDYLVSQMRLSWVMGRDIRKMSL